MCKLLTFPHFPSVGKLKTIFKTIFKTNFKIMFKTIFSFGIGLQVVHILSGADGAPDGWFLKTFFRTDSPGMWPNPKDFPHVLIQRCRVCCVALGGAPLHAILLVCKNGHHGTRFVPVNCE